MLSAPTEMSATRAPLADRKAGSASPLPWCGTLSTSARRSVPSRTSRASASAPRSPVNRIRRPATVTRTTRDRSLASAAAVARSGAGASTSTETPASERRSPGTRTTCRPRASWTARAKTPALSSAGDRVPVATTPTSRPPKAPARPPTWSASRWETRTSGSSSIPSRSRQRSIAAASGPASISSPAPGPVGSTKASPWPTSQPTATVPVGGQPRTAWRTGQPRTTSPRSTASASGRSRRKRHSPQPTASSRTVRRTAPTVPAGQLVVPSGTPAARSATRTSQRVGHPAPQTSASARSGRGTPTSAASSPRTVATGTAGAASRLAGRETMLTVPESPATIGAVTTPAAALTATASASTAQRPR